MARVRYQYDQSFATDDSCPVKLWILRILVLLGGYKPFIKKDDFDNDYMAKVIGLEKWIGPEAPAFDPSLVRHDLNRLHAQAERAAAKAGLPDALSKNVERLAHLVELIEVDKQILTFATFIKNDRLLDDAGDYLGQLSSIKVAQALSVILNLPEKDVRYALSSNGTLSRTGLVRLDHSSTNTLKGKIDLLTSELPDQMMSNEGDDLSALFKDVVSQSPAPTLTLSDFTHIDRPLSILRPYLAGVLDTRKRGVNIYLHGQPGTGKTQLARAIAKDLGCDLLEVSSQNDEGNAVEGEARLRAYQFAQSLFARRRAVILFDEVEDVFDEDRGFFARKSIAQKRKAWINKTLEENPVPALWLSNSIGGLDPAFVRRFDMVLELPVPPKAQRSCFIQKSCGHLLTPETIMRIADCEQLSPAVISRAVSVIETVSDGMSADKASEAVEYLVGNTLVAQGHKPLSRANALALPGIYDPSLINADADLAAIAEGISRNRVARLCLFGPPGTGKSAYGRWLAERLGMPLHLRRASELLSKFVGGTEKNLAKAFQVAEQEGAVLMLDEIDSFLQDRRDAYHSWEITEVNEMLTQMEAFEGVMIATTNLIDNLDQASLRRFDLKIKFDYLTTSQSWDLLCRHCKALKIPAPDNSLGARLENYAMLTPGDFAAVARMQRFNPISSPKAFVDALEKEFKAKEGATHSSIGFV